MSLFKSPNRSRRSNNALIPKPERIHGPQATSLEIKQPKLKARIGSMILPPMTLIEASARREDMRSRDEQTTDLLTNHIAEVVQRQPTPTEQITPANN